MYFSNTHSYCLADWFWIDFYLQNFCHFKKMIYKGTQIANQMLQQDLWETIKKCC